LPFGSIRISENSSAAGHNGVQSIIDNLGTQNFKRIRIGVESRISKNEIPTDAFVLQNFTSNELAKLQAEILQKIKTEIIRFIEN
jgi:PTH1 family peptidyl-tRNA hydrolase